MRRHDLNLSISWELEKRAYPLAPPEFFDLGKNEITNAAFFYLLDVLMGTGVAAGWSTPLNSTYAFIGVGSSSTAFSTGQTDLQAAVSTSLTVTAASNTSPIQVATSTPHGLTTGNSVTINGAGGNTAVNGSWSVTVVDTTNFTCNGSTGNGVWTTGGTAGSGNRTRKPMVSTFPSRVSQQINFQSSFGAAEANYAWAEWGLFKAPPTPVMISRRVQALGTKVTPNVWTLTAHLALA